MSVIPMDEDGLRAVDRALDRGGPVIWPSPSPLPYTVAGVDPLAVNAVKGRPGGQPVGMVLADLGLVARYVELDAATLAFAEWLSADRLLNLFLPVRPGIPGWLQPSTSEGTLGVTLACLDQTRGVLDRRGHLYLSSANRTGGEVAVTAAAADTAFDSQLPVLDGDAARDPSVASGSATIVRVRPDRHLEVVRHGINDAGYAGDTERFRRDLAQGWATHRPWYSVS